MAGLQEFIYFIFWSLGAMLVIGVMIYLLLTVITRTKKVGKSLIMYRQFKQCKDLYDLKNTVLISKSGHLLYTAWDGTLEEREEVLKSALRQNKNMMELKDKFKGDNNEK